MITGGALGDTSLNILWSKVWCRSREYIMETRAEHHNELGIATGQHTGSRKREQRVERVSGSLKPVSISVSHILQCRSCLLAHIHGVVRAPVSAAEIRIPS